MQPIVGAVCESILKTNYNEPIIGYVFFPWRTLPQDKKSQSLRKSERLATQPWEKVHRTTEAGKVRSLVLMAMECNVQEKGSEAEGILVGTWIDGILRRRPDAREQTRSAACLEN